MRYSLITAGVNASPQQTILDWAEKDAQDFHDLMTSAIGPSPQTTHLLGRAATGQSISRAFMSSALVQPDFLVFYFSGHGDENGLAVADGALHHSNLVDFIRMVDAPHTLLVLDVCRAASFWGWIKEASEGFAGVPETTWFDVLAQATPSTRMMFSTGPMRDAGERDDLQNGVFTHGLIKALTTMWPTLPAHDPTFITDVAAFSAARRFVRRVDPTQTPVAVGLTGDFPMVKSEKVEIVGDASLERVVVFPDHIKLTVRVAKRHKLKTKCAITLHNNNGKVLDFAESVLRPTSKESAYTVTYRVDRRKILADIASRIALLNGDAPLTLNVRLLDGVGDPLDQQFARLVYRR